MKKMINYLLLLNVLAIFVAAQAIEANDPEDYVVIKDLEACQNGEVKTVKNKSATREIKVFVLKRTFRPIEVPLFSADISEKSKLNEKKISKKLEQAFVNAGFKLSSDAGVFVKKKGQEWRIRDLKKKKIYQIIFSAQENVLNVLLYRELEKEEMIKKRLQPKETFILGCNYDANENRYFTWVIKDAAFVDALAFVKIFVSNNNCNIGKQILLSNSHKERAIVATILVIETLPNGGQQQFTESYLVYPGDNVFLGCSITFGSVKTWKLKDASFQ